MSVDRYRVTIEVIASDQDDAKRVASKILAAHPYLAKVELKHPELAAAPMTESKQDEPS